MFNTLNLGLEIYFLLLNTRIHVFYKMDNNADRNLLITTNGSVCKKDTHLYVIVFTHKLTLKKF